MLVFGNVVMRYAFNSGFTISEELSRWLFVWLTFLGAVVALRSNSHLGTDMLVGRLGPAGKRICMGIALALMLYCLWLLFRVLRSDDHQLVVNQRRDGGVDGVVLLGGYGDGCPAGALIVLSDLWRLVAGKLDDDHLVLMQESEEAPHTPANAGKWGAP